MNKTTTQTGQQVNITFSPDETKILKEIASEKHLSQDKVIRKALRAYYENLQSKLGKLVDNIITTADKGMFDGKSYEDAIEDASEADFIKYLKETSKTAPSWYAENVLKKYTSREIDRMSAVNEAQDYELSLLCYLEELATKEEYFAVVYDNRKLLVESMLGEGIGGLRKDYTMEDLLCIYAHVNPEIPKPEDCQMYLQAGKQKLQSAEELLRQNGGYKYNYIAK